MSHRRVLLADVASTAAAVATPLHRVLVQGLCVWTEWLGERLLRVEIDDGTDVALLQVQDDAAVAELQDVQPGKLVKALGVLQDSPVFASGRSWRKWVDVASVTVVDDPNAESLFMLETLLLQKAFLSKPPPPSPRNAPLSTSIPLLGFPTQDAQAEPPVGSKRKPDAPVRPTQPLVLEMQSQSRLLNQPTGVVPPALYQFHVTSIDLKLLENGTKTLEIRLNNPPYSIIRANDRIKFNSKIVGTVKAVRKYAQLRSALELETLSSLLPQMGGSSSNINAAIRHFRQFISETEEKNHGVAIFEIEVQPSRAAAATPRTPEEWSKLIYEHVGKAGASGCSLRDLQFAFPALSVDKIDAMLTDLQMDAVVYLAKGMYRLV